MNSPIKGELTVQAPMARRARANAKARSAIGLPQFDDNPNAPVRLRGLATNTGYDARHMGQMYSDRAFESGVGDVAPVHGKL